MLKVDDAEKHKEKWLDITSSSIFDHISRNIDSDFKLAIV